MSYQYLPQVESKYGLAGPLSSKLIHDGPDNYVYIVTDANGKKYALRINKRLGKNVSFELEVLVTLAQKGLNITRPLETKSKEYFILINNNQVVLFDFIEGTQVEKLDTEHLETDVIERGARKFGEFHNFTNNMKVETVPNRNIFTEYDRLLALDTDTLKKFTDYEILLKQVKTFYSEAQSRIKEGKELYGVIHNDYRIQNLIYTKDDCYIIDLDWACYGPILKDLGLAIAEWSMYKKDTGPSKIAIDRFLKSYNETAPKTVAYDKDLIFWICFACLSDTCTFIADVVQNNFKYGDIAINDVNQCRMYRKFQYFYQELN